MIIVRKTVDLVQRERRQKRGGLTSREPLRAVAAAMNEECARLLDLLGADELRKVVAWKREGHNNTEIAGLLGCTRVTVQRMLSVIQQIWRLEMAA